MKRKLKLSLPFKSIRTVMLIPFSFLIVAALVIFSAISLSYTEKAVMTNSIEYTSMLIKQVNRDIDSYIDYMENISDLVVNSSDVQKYLFEDADFNGSEEVYGRIVAQFVTVLRTRSDISNIAVMSPGGESIINTGFDALNEYVSMEDLEWYRKAMEKEGTVLTASHVQNAIRNNYKWVVTLSRGIKDSATGRRKGIFFIDLNYKVLKDLCEDNNLGFEGYIYIIDREGRIIYHPKQQLLYSELRKERTTQILEKAGSYFVTSEGEDSKLYTVSTSAKTGWSVVGVERVQELMRGRDETQKLYLLTAVILLVLAVLLTLMISSAVTGPIKRLKKSMLDVERGNFEISDSDMDVMEQNEIGSLSHSFNRMTEKIKRLMEENTFEQEQKRKSELKALQSQINPHFLYNTLDSIIWMAEGGETQEVVLMTSSLSKLLRQSISNEDEIVSIQYELNYTKSYLVIQKMRYRDKLEYSIDMEPGTGDAKIVKLVIQPLVENAIYHGVKYKEDKGFIKISVYEKNRDIFIEVIDNGVGMDKEMLQHIFDQRQDKSRKRSGVGVYNVQMRLQLYYGEAYGITYESVYGEGTRATIRIPRVPKAAGEVSV